VTERGIYFSFIEMKPTLICDFPAVPDQSSRPYSLRITIVFGRYPSIYTQ
jgi:hypothetical protein